MPHLQLHDASYSLAVGETRVGWGDDADLRLPDVDDARSAIAVITLSPEGIAAVRSDAHGEGDGGEERVLVNGVPVGGGREAAPLLHGDRLTIHGCELRFADEAMSGDTGEFPALAPTHVAVPSVGVLDARSGGRLISMVDGREYRVGGSPLVIGRDASCDIVIASPKVSRRHAELRALPDDGGYEIIDHSRMGLLVNDGRVKDRVALGRGDMIQIGDESFRFGADSEPSAPPRELSDVPSLQRTGATPVAKRGAVSTLTPAGVSAVTPTRPGTLASLTILNPGPSRGTRFDLIAPLSHVGRGAYNDVAVLDESVSESHAKIQRRDDGWWVVDMDSTNGTYVNGKRVGGEALLTSGSDVRFGGIKMSFHTVGEAPRNDGATRVIVGIRAPDPQRVAAPVTPTKGEERGAADDTRGGGSRIVWIVLAALAAIFVYLVLQGR